MNLKHSRQSNHYDQHSHYEGINEKENSYNLTISFNGSTKNVKRLSDYGQSPKNHIQTSRLKNHSHLGKNLSKKLFQRAKKIQDPSKETFLTTSEKQLHKHHLHFPSQSSYTFLNVHDLKKIRSQSSKKQNSKSSNQKSDDSEKSSKKIKQSKAFRKSGKSNSSAQRTNQEQQLKLDEEQNKMIAENNLFRSRAGQQLLNNLNFKLSRISSIQKRKSNQDFQQLVWNKRMSKSSKGLGLEIRKIDSFDLQTQDSFIRQNKGDKVFKIDQQKQKQSTEMTSFSKLIMQDHYKMC